MGEAQEALMATLMCWRGWRFTAIFLGDFPFVFFLLLVLFPLLQSQSNVCASFRRMNERILHLTDAVLVSDAWIDKG